MWISFAYGLLGWLTYYNEGRPTAGLVVFLFLAVAGFGVRTGSVGSILAIFAFFTSACVACVVPFGLTFAPVCLVAAPLLLVGSLKAARFVAAEQTRAFSEAEVEWLVRARKLWAALRPLPAILIGLLGLCAGLAVLFGTVLGLYTMGRDYSMEPNLHAGDWLVSVNAPVSGGIHRGDIVAFPYWGGFGAERVVGLPGDRIQVEAGKLILNGKFVPEPYVKKAYRKGPGDFPLPSEAFPDGLMRSEYENAYRQNLKKGDVFIVPRDAYFLLNDDRNELMDSRIFGPLSKRNVTGRPLLAFSPWSLPRFLF
jgi:signal peptidase I